MMEKKVNQQGTISEKKWHFKRAFCRIIGEPGIHGIAFGFLWCRGVFGSLSHFRQSSGAVPPWALYRWAHVWRNEPQAIILSFSFSPPLPLPPSLSVCVDFSLLSVYLFLLPLPSLPSFSSRSLHLLYLSLSPSLPFMHLFFLSIPFFTHPFFPLPFPPSVSTPSPLRYIPSSPVVTVSWGCRVSSLCSGSRGTRREARRNELTETQEPISGLCYRKICPFTLRRAARRADGGRVMGRCCRRNRHTLLLFWWSLSSQQPQNSCGV